eukprot:CAMPEP_0182469696 /NCGR_PEP_ID=MMETSP1319-20130603/17507_1 /TAXON_ID=172717 /ORGANISM="Bolidomonas pacifica, Strain RCC208" /LENGTH=136 /DNA_ID=CAMNT_0024670029 /DNA_START=150 /DNA_END=556 /DNA_ORIENTATION=-
MSFTPVPLRPHPPSFIPLPTHQPSASPLFSIPPSALSVISSAEAATPTGRTRPLRLACYGLFLVVSLSLGVACAADLGGSREAGELCGASPLRGVAGAVVGCLGSAAAGTFVYQEIRGREVARQEIYDEVLRRKGV